MMCIRLSPFCCVLLFIPGLFCLSGCGSGMGQVEGKVIWADGSPAKELDTSQVVFESAALRISARGTISPDGSFKLSTNKPDDGCPIGDFDVMIVENRKNANPEGTLLMPAILHPKYAELKTSDLKVTVKSGINPVTLKVEKIEKAK